MSFALKVGNANFEMFQPKLPFSRFSRFSTLANSWSKFMAPIHGVRSWSQFMAISPNVTAVCVGKVWNKTEMFCQRSSADTIDCIWIFRWCVSGRLGVANLLKSQTWSLSKCSSTLYYPLLPSTTELENVFRMFRSAPVEWKPDDSVPICTEDLCQKTSEDGRVRPITNARLSRWLSSSLFTAPNIPSTLALEFESVEYRSAGNRSDSLARG